MSDNTCYLLFLDTAIDLGDPALSLSEQLASLKQFILDKGKIPELDSGAVDFPQWLLDNDIAHHFEWVPFEKEHCLETLFVVHVYDSNVVVHIRLGTDLKPMQAGWRKRWLEMAGRYGAIDLGGLSGL